MKFLAIDYGQKRTGIALSTPEGDFAYPCCTIQMQGKDHFFAKLLAIAEQEKIEAYVVGIPLMLDGSESETTRQVYNMIARLKRRTSLPVYGIDEALTSMDAEVRLRATGRHGKKIKDVLDQAAAVTILESFLSLPEVQRRLV